MLGLNDLVEIGSFADVMASGISLGSSSAFIGGSWRGEHVAEAAGVQFIK
jgi:hypothetical protein